MKPSEHLFDVAVVGGCKKSTPQGQCTPGAGTPVQFQFVTLHRRLTGERLTTVVDGYQRHGGWSAVAVQVLVVAWLCYPTKLRHRLYVMVVVMLGR